MENNAISNPFVVGKYISEAYFCDREEETAFLKKQGFVYCGIIHVEEDNDPRFAYEKSAVAAEG